MRDLSLTPYGLVDGKRAPVTVTFTATNLVGQDLSFLDLSTQVNFKCLTKVEFSDPMPQPVPGVVQVPVFDDFDVIEHPKAA